MTTIYEEAGIHIPITYGYYKNPIDRTLHVIWNKDKLVFSIYYGSGNLIEGDWEKDNIGTKEEINGSLSEISILIEDIARKKYAQDEDIQSVNGNMKGLGQTLFQRLLPDKLSKKAKAWESGTVMCISTNESWIPWEMLNDGLGFWGQRFLLFRIPRRRIELDNIQMEKVINNHNKKPISKVVHVIGGGIAANCVKRAKTIFDPISSRVLVETLVQTNFANLMRQSGEADILHFTCHCDDGCLQISGKRDKQINLLINSIKNTDFVIREGSIIFANACGSSSPQAIFGDFANFGWEFINKGASIFIGTIGAIPIESAIVFAESFYGSLFDNSNDDDGLICKSFLNAKNHMEKRNDFWHLLYCIYGNPICSGIYFKEVKCQ